MIWRIILLVIAVIILSLIIDSENKKHGNGGTIWLTIIISWLALSTLVPLVNWNKPTALDVYRDKTELVVTYNNDVAVDSTVVYKVN